MLGTLTALSLLAHLAFLSGYTIMFISHMLNRRQADVKYLARGDTARKWQHLEFNPGSWDPKALSNAVSLEPE